MLKRQLSKEHYMTWPYVNFFCLYNVIYRCGLLPSSVYSVHWLINVGQLIISRKYFLNLRYSPFLIQGLAITLRYPYYFVIQQVVIIRSEKSIVACITFIKLLKCIISGKAA